MRGREARERGWGGARIRADTAFRTTTGPQLRPRHAPRPMSGSSAKAPVARAAQRSRVCRDFMAGVRARTLGGVLRGADRAEWVRRRRNRRPREPRPVPAASAHPPLVPLGSERSSATCAVCLHPPATVTCGALARVFSIGEERSEPAPPPPFAASPANPLPPVPTHSRTPTQHPSAPVPPQPLRRALRARLDCGGEARRGAGRLLTDPPPSAASPPIDARASSATPFGSDPRVRPCREPASDSAAPPATPRNVHRAFRAETRLRPPRRPLFRALSRCPPACARSLPSSR